MPARRQRSQAQPIQERSGDGLVPEMLRWKKEFGTRPSPLLSPRLLNRPCSRPKPPVFYLRLVGCSLRCGGKQLASKKHRCKDLYRHIMRKKPLTNEELTELTVGINKLARNLWWTWDQEAQ